MKLVVILSVLFTLFSFAPNIIEFSQVSRIPLEREFVLEHNYLFDYNFYLSRIRQGMEGRWLVTEKYYNHSHPSSLIHIFYLYLGKPGGIIGLNPPAVYHFGRFLFGLTFLLVIGRFVKSLLPGWWSVVGFLFIVTAGSWPIFKEVASGWRFATHMGWWSVIDSLQRITTMPHILFGQMFLLLFIWRFSGGFPILYHKSLKLLTSFKLLILGILGFVVGIVFPPTLIVVYTWFFVMSSIELLSLYKDGQARKHWIVNTLVPRGVFFICSFPSLLYLQKMMTVLPWSALALFDIQHRMPIPYWDYVLALGPVLPLGFIGLIIVFIRREKRLYPLVAWILAIGALFVTFEYVPQQSPLRFTEAIIYVPLGILATYLFYQLFLLSNLSHLGYLRKYVKMGIGITIGSIIALGFLVMISMVGWLSDQVIARREGTWRVPIGGQLIYPLRDFMEGVRFIRDNTKKEDVVLTYVTAGNYIPAYAGNLVYIGHSNTPEEDRKEKIVARFFSGAMNRQEAEEFITKERVSYVFVGPQERDFMDGREFTLIYPNVEEIYRNNEVTIYRLLF